MKNTNNSILPFNDTVFFSQREFSSIIEYGNYSFGTIVFIAVLNFFSDLIVDLICSSLFQC